MKQCSDGLTQFDKYACTLASYGNSIFFLNLYYTILHAITELAPRPIQSSIYDVSLCVCFSVCLSPPLSMKKERNLIINFM